MAILKSQGALNFMYIAVICNGELFSPLRFFQPQQPIVS